MDKPQETNENAQRRAQRFRIARLAFLSFLALAVLGFFWVVLRPLLAPIVLAVLVAVLAYPSHAWIGRRLGGRAALAAIISMVLLSLFVVVPVVAFGLLFLVQMRGVLQEVIGLQLSDLRGSVLFQRIEDYLEWFARVAAQYTGDQLDLRGLGVSAMRDVSRTLYAHLPDLLGIAGSLLLAYIVLNIVLFFLLYQGPTIIDTLIELSPMSDRYERQILARVRSTIQAVFVGSLLTSLFQGGIGMVGLLVVGINNAVAWGVLMAVCSLIPIVGTAIIWGPAALYLWFDGSSGLALVLLLFGLTISYSDNIIRPLFIRGRASISPLLIFLSVFGGLQTAGAMGLIYGPLLAATVVEVVRIYRSDFMIPDEESAREILAEPAPTQDFDLAEKSPQGTRDESLPPTTGA